MSVINKMLKDLDDRQEPEAPQAGVASGNQQAVPNNKGSKSNTGIIIVLCVIAVLLGFISWQILNAKGMGEQSLSNQTDSALVASQSNSEKNTTSESLPIPELDEDPDPNEELEAELAQQAPAIEPEQLDVDLVATTRVQPPREKADKLVAESAPSPVASPLIKPATADMVESNQELTTSAKPEPTFVIEKTSNKLTPEQRVEKLLNKARSSYEKGYITEAIEDLTKLLSISDSNIEARTLLAGAWYGRGEGNRAIAIINDGLQRYPLIEEWRTTAAKIFFKENNLAGAFSYLNVELTNASKEFYTLKGNLARQLKQYPAAESAYQKLSEIEPFVGNWWLGLAIVQDSQSKQQALQNYKKVIEIGGVSAQSMTFAQQRIDVLKG